MDQDCSVSRPSNVDGPNSISVSGCQTYSCPSCYRGSSTQKCCNNGALTGSFPSCYKADCSVSKPSCVGGPTSIACGRSATYNCECGKSGYSTIQTCSNGVLSGSFPQCKDRDCSVSRPTGVDGPNTIAAGTCETFRCATCYHSGSSQRCCNNGATSGNFPSCSKVICQTSHRRPCVSGPQSMECGQTATFTCICGTEPDSLTHTCLSNGQLDGFGSGFYSGYPNCRTYHSVSVCEGRTLDISCPAGLYLELNVVDYKISEASKCPGDYRNVNCWSSNDVRPQLDRCDKKKSCRQAVNSRIFRDPCPKSRQPKHLDVSYQCRNVLD